MTQKVNVVVLAAGKGTRMKSSLPKVLHRLAGKSLLQHNLDLATALSASAINVVIGHGAERIREDVGDQPVIYHLQEEQLGTGHAVAQAMNGLQDDAIVLVLYGDVPLIEQDTALGLLDMSNENKMAVLTCIMPDPTGLGRIIRNGGGLVIGIVEEKDADKKQKAIQETNTGIMAIPVNRLRKWLPQLRDDNSQGEYYLTDIIAMAHEDGCEVAAKVSSNPMEVMGVNNREQLAQLERYYQKKRASELMLNGVTLADPDRIDLRGEISIAEDVEIDINVIMEGKVEIASGVKIGPHCVIKNTSIAENSMVNAYSHIEDAVIGSQCSIGPFARIRPGTKVMDEARIGNFVETKKALIGKGSKVNHLSYIGDSELGEKVNIGAGTITCNYDGVNKFKTIIGNDVFVGSNTALVAPLTVADGVTIGAGSTITRDVAGPGLALSRSRQQDIPGWKRPTRK